MSGVRSEKWTDEKLEQIKTLMLESFSMSQIGEKMGETRNAIIGIITRNPEFFKGVPRLPKTKPTKRDSEARRRLMSNPSRPPREVVAENPDDLKSMRKLEMTPAKDIVEPWKQAAKGDKMFFYWKNETEPTFVFRRHGPGSNWRGHGVYAMTKGHIWAWINGQRK